VRGDPPHSDVRVHELLEELRESAPPTGVDLAQRVAGRASRQQATMTFVQLLIVIARAIPHAAVLAMGRRR